MSFDSEFTSSFRSFQPGTVAELARLLTDPEASAGGLQIVGGATALEFGGGDTFQNQQSQDNNQPNEDLQSIDSLSLEQFTQLIDYPSRDMTVTVQAGMTLAELQRTLAAEGQQLPIDVPYAAQATVGGVLACDVSGPRRFGYGTLRDYLIGVEAVDGQGRVFHAGGKVVKNVAGYDLCKLLIGSLGTLAVITEATFKVRPLPAAGSWVHAAFEHATDAEQILQQLLVSPLRPVAVEVLTGTAPKTVTQRLNAGDPAASWVLLVCFEGTRAEVDWQTAEWQKLLQASAATDLREFTGDDAETVRATLTDFAVHADDPHTSNMSELILQTSVRASRLWDFLRIARDKQLSSVAHAGNGVIISRKSVSEHEEAGLPKLVADLRGFARELDGDLVILTAPANSEVDRRPAARDGLEWQLMRRVKDMFDPRGILNPGKLWPSSADNPSANNPPAVGGTNEALS